MRLILSLTFVFCGTLSSRAEDRAGVSHDPLDSEISYTEETHWVDAIKTCYAQVLMADEIDTEKVVNELSNFGIQNHGAYAEGTDDHFILVSKTGLGQDSTKASLVSSLMRGLSAVSSGSTFGPMTNSKGTNVVDLASFGSLQLSAFIDKHACK